MQEKNSIISIIGAVIAGVALLIAAVPIVNNFAFVLAILALILGLIGLAKTRKPRRRGYNIAVVAVVLALLAGTVVLVSQAIYGAAINEAVDSANDSIDRASGEQTDELLANDVAVDIGKFVVTTDEYDMATTELPVKVTNRVDEAKSYSIQIEAVDENGSRITDDYVYANDLGANQSQDFKAFQYVESDKLDKVKNAEFKIVSVSQT